jgi:hypothetical protein
VAIPTAVAIQWVDVTTPKVPSISGRVVNGSGLTLLIGTYGCGDAVAAGALDHSRSGLPTATGYGPAPIRVIMPGLLLRRYC